MSFSEFRKEIINSLVIQVCLSASVVLMKDIIQKVSTTDKQITLALRRSNWQSYLLSIGSISAVALSVSSISAILDIEPVVGAGLPTYLPSCLDVGGFPDIREPAFILSEQSASLPEQITKQEQVNYISSHLSEHNCSKELDQKPNSNVFSQLKGVAEASPSSCLELSTSKREQNFNLQQAATINSTVVNASKNNERFANTVYYDPCADNNVAQQSAVPLTLNSVKHNPPEQLAIGEKTTTVQPALVSKTPTIQPAVNSVEQNLLAQSSVENEQEPPLVPQNSPQTLDALSPSLQLQGVYLNQGNSSARARLTGIYPVSPNALFGATVDLTTGDDFADSESEGLDLNELYFAGSLPQLPELRLVVGQLDLTSYFDRNSFAKDGTTHFFNPVFQTNPALASAGIGSRPAVLLNWNITDNIEAKVAGFSSARNLGDLDLDGFAGEIGFRAGTAIVRGTYVSARDAKENGFREIFGIERDNGDFGPESNDREQAFGVNGEVFIPQINMGLFARYGWYENRELDESGNTYSLGVSFLDLFMQDDRLGLGYGRNLSNDDLRRDNEDRVPDVWELFYDFRVSPNLRAGVTLQGRDEFSDTILGVRVKTEFDLISPRR